MTFIATKPKSTYEAPPPGNHIARCYALVDLGTQEKTYEGKVTGKARKIRFQWELLGGDVMKDGRPFSVSKSYFVSLHEKSTMRRDLESWRGRAFSPEEEGAFDLETVVDKYCLLNIVQEADGKGNVYANIATISPLIKGMAKPSPVSDSFVFDLDRFDAELFEKLGDRTKQIIMLSPEWAQISGSPSAPSAPKAATNDGFDDDIPF
jgi:hypothetical protein